MVRNLKPAGTNKNNETISPVITRLVPQITEIFPTGGSERSEAMLTQK